MNTYSFVFLLNDQDTAAKLKEHIVAINGTLTAEKSHGKKNLAYPIAKLKTADLYEWTFEAPSVNLNDFKKRLSFEDNLLRYLLIKKDN